LFDLHVKKKNRSKNISLTLKNYHILYYLFYFFLLRLSFCFATDVTLTMNDNLEDKLDGTLFWMDDDVTTLTKKLDLQIHAELEMQAQVQIHAELEMQEHSSKERMNLLHHYLEAIKKINWDDFFSVVVSQKMDETAAMDV
jgi:hypothetical protein